MTNTNQTMPGMDEYCHSIDDLRFSEEAKGRMAARLAKAAAEAPTPATPQAPGTSRRRRRLPLAAAAAGLALALGLGGVAYATGSLMSVQRFVSHLFGAEEPKVEIVDKVGHPVGVAQSVGGVTVSADAIIGDRSNVAVVFSVSKDDGTAFEGIETLEGGLLPLGFASDMSIDLPLFAGGYGATGSSYFYDEDPSDNALQLVETRSFGTDGGGDLSLVGRMLTAHFSDLTYYGENGEATIIAPGSWKLSFPLDYEDATVDLPAGQSFEVNGIPATIDKLSVSPIALHVTYTAEHEATWTSGESGRQSEQDSKLIDTLLGIEVTLNMADGTSLEVEHTGGGSIGSEGDHARCETGIFFDRIVDLDEVASITIGGTTIEL